MTPFTSLRARELLIFVHSLKHPTDEFGDVAVLAPFVFFPCELKLKPSAFFGLCFDGFRCGGCLGLCRSPFSVGGFPSGPAARLRHCLKELALFSCFEPRQRRCEQRTESN